MENGSNKQNGKRKQNEILLDAVMQEHNKKEQTQKKRAILLKKDNKVAKPFKKTKLDKHEKEGWDESATQPVYVVNNRFYGKKRIVKKLKGKVIAISAILGVVVFLSIFLSVFYFSKHEINIVSGHREAITFIDTNGEELNIISLRVNESVKFKIKLDNHYSDEMLSVTYNNIAIEPNSEGYYTIKYIGKAELRITGIVEKLYKISFASNTMLDFKVFDSGKWVVGSGETYENFFGKQLKFIITNQLDNTPLPQSHAAVYVGNTLLNCNSLGEYFYLFNANEIIEVYYHSPFQYFEINETDESVKITGITSLGQDAKTLSFPVTINNKPISFVFGDSYYPQISEIVIEYNSKILEKDFNNFNDLQIITVKNPNNAQGYFSENGVLYFKGDSNKISFKKCPQGYGKLSQEKSLSLNENTISIETGAFNKTNYLKKLVIGANVSQIKPLSLKGTVTENQFEIEFKNNLNFKINEDIIYTYNNSQIIASPFKSGDVKFVGNFKVADNAFSFSNIKTLTFEGVFEFSTFALANMEEVTKITLPENVSNLDTYMFFGCRVLQAVSLTEIPSKINIDNNAFEQNINFKYIVVSDELYVEYKIENADKWFVDKFISYSDYIKL